MKKHDQNKTRKACNSAPRKKVPYKKNAIRNTNKGTT